MKYQNLTHSFTAVRGQAYADLLDGDPDDNAPVEDWVILNGNRAITGPAAFDPLRADNQARRKEASEAEQEKRDMKRREAAEREQLWEMENLARWNAQMTVIDGVKMTNEDAQKSRKHIIEHEDEYARRAVDEGRIKAGDEEAYKATNRKIYEIKDKIGRGTATAEEKHTCDQLENSALGHAVDHDAAQYYKQSMSQTLDTKTTASGARAALAVGAVASDNLFQSAPPVQTHFAAVVSPAPTVVAPSAADPAPMRLPAEKQATGFNL